MAADPLGDFRQLLQQSPDRGDEKQIKAHKERIEKAAAALVRPSDLRHALLLYEWRGHLPQQPNGVGEEEEPLVPVFQKVRGALADRLKASLRDGLGAKEAGRRLATVVFLASMAHDENEREGVQIHAGPEIRQPRSLRFTPSMAADVRMVLANDRDAEVRAAAVEAVVRIDPLGKETLAALKPLLDPKRETIERRAAAKGLERIIGTLAESEGQHAPRAARPGSTLERTGPDVLTACAVGLSDDDATVRRPCLETIGQVAQALTNEMGYRPELSRSLVRALNAQTKEVSRHLADADLNVCLAAHQTLEAIATTRQFLRGERSEAGQEFLVNKPARTAADRALLDDILAALPQLEKSLTHEEVRVRLASLYVLETLNAGAEPAAAAVVRALEDKNGFVRWGAARVLNNMAPQAAEKAVPALVTALKDDNKTVRLTAVNALRRYGPRAAEAAGPLGAAVGDAEPQIRLGAINALAAIGEKAAGQSSVLVRALKDDKTPEARAAAARALSRLGALGKESVKALRYALHDPDGTVRQAAGDALLDNP
jgi:HEAT repeat protein